MQNTADDADALTLFLLNRYVGTRLLAYTIH